MNRFQNHSPEWSRIALLTSVAWHCFFAESMHHQRCISTDQKSLFCDEAGNYSPTKILLSLGDAKANMPHPVELLASGHGQDCKTQGTVVPCSPEHGHSEKSILIGWCVWHVMAFCVLWPSTHLSSWEISSCRTDFSAWKERIPVWPCIMRSISVGTAVDIFQSKKTNLLK